MLVQEHDVAGAAAAGIDSLFVAGGIHREALGIDAEGGFTRGILGSHTVAELCSDYGTAHPTFSIPFLVA